MANRTSGTGALGPHSDPARRARQHSCSRPAPAIPAHPAWGPMGRLSRLDAMHFAGHRPAGSVEKGTSLHLETPTPQMVFVLSSYRHASGTLDALADRRCRQGDGASRNFCIICTFRGQINPQALYFILRRPRRYHWLARGCVVHLSWGVAGASAAPATDGPRSAVRAAERPCSGRDLGARSSTTIEGGHTEHAPWLHADRVARRDRDHRDPRRHPLPCLCPSTRAGKADRLPPVSYTHLPLPTISSV